MTKRGEIVDPVVERGVIGLDGEDIAAVALKLCANFEHGESVGVEMDPAGLVGEDETYFSCEKASATVPDCETLLLVEDEIVDMTVSLSK